jgi:hypothetical protein
MNRWQVKNVQAAHCGGTFRFGGDSTRQSVLFPHLFFKPLLAQFDERHGSSDGGAILLKACDAALDAFGVSPWDVDRVRAALLSRGLSARVDTSSAHLGPDGKYVADDIHQAAFQSYHTTTPNGFNLQLSWMTRVDCCRFRGHTL